MKTLKETIVIGRDNNKENTRNLNRERLKRLVRVILVAGQAVRRLESNLEALLAFIYAKACPILQSPGVVSPRRLWRFFTGSGQVTDKSIEKTDSMESKQTIPIYY